jgi:hypothetical protein
VESARAEIGRVLSRPRARGAVTVGAGRPAGAASGVVDH